MSKTTNKFSPEVRERAVRLVFVNEGQHACPLAGRHVNLGEDWLHAADAERLGQEGWGRQRQTSRRPDRYGREDEGA